ncbi:MAG: RNA polymerase sigma factor [Acidobacteriota bacterium]
MFDQLNREKVFDGILEALEEMPEELRQMFVLGHYRGLSATQIAQEIGQEQQKVETLLRRADEFLYKKLRSLRAARTPDRSRDCLTAPATA